MAATIPESPGIQVTATPLQRAADLVALLQKNAARTEADRRVAEENIRALEEAGLFGLTVPRRFGGEEQSIRAYVEATLELARGCGATAWVTTLINISEWLVGLFPEQAQREVWGEDPRTRVCGVLAPTSTSRAVEGGLVVTGRWAFASGCQHAQWAVLAVPVVDAAGEQIDQGMALIPMQELVIEDTWHVAGMRGTGSNTLIAHEVFVPEHRMVSSTKALRGEFPVGASAGQLYHTAFAPVLALVLAAPLVGLARAGAEVVADSLAKGKGITLTFYEKSSEAPTSQLQYAEAVQLTDTAELHLMRAADDLDSWAAEREVMPLLNRARVRMDTGYAARRAREALDLLLNVQGAGSFADANPLQRIWRDLETGSRHAMVNPAISAEMYGRALLGVEEQVTPVL
jgi:3-hydroxy-9,10-secoandrosta-1,3,5(10)-triene-9,17-dione monooxygenase